VRKLRYFEPRQYVSIDYARRDVLVIRVNDQVDEGSQSELARAAAGFVATGKIDPEVIQTLLASGRIPATLLMQIAAAKNNPEKLKEIARSLEAPPDGPAPGLSFAKPEVTPGEPLRLEILSFLESVRSRREPKVTARQGRAALELALTIQATMAAHAARAGLGDFFKN
jgi:hypothetical protein